MNIPKVVTVAPNDGLARACVPAALVALSRLVAVRCAGPHLGAARPQVPQVVPDGRTPFRLEFGCWITLKFVRM